MIYRADGLVELSELTSTGNLEAAWSVFRRARMIGKIDEFTLHQYHAELEKLTAKFEVPITFRTHPDFDRKYQNPLTPKLIRDLSDIVENHVSAFLYEKMGLSLGWSEVRRLQKAGVLDKNVKRTDFPADEFAFGRVLDLLRLGVDYQDAVRQAHRAPVTELEKAAIEQIRQAACEHVTGLGNSFTGELREIMLKKNRSYVQGMMATGAEKKMTAQEIASEIGHATKDWGRDLYRITYTEGHNAQQYASLIDMKKKFGYDPATGKEKELYVAREPELDACKYCYQLYVKPDGTLIGFKLNEILAGPVDNYGRKASKIGSDGGWLPVVGATHPYCRCRWVMYNRAFHSRKLITEWIALGKLPASALQPVDRYRKNYLEHFGK